MSIRSGGPLYRPLDVLLVRAPRLPVERYRSLPSTGPDADDVRLAVGVASPALAQALDRPVPSRSASAALLRYAIRMSTRPTPYGLFAGVAVARWAPTTGLRIGPGPWPTRSRVDMEVLCGLVHVLERDPEVLPHLRLVANPCALERDGRVVLSDRRAGSLQDGQDVSVRATAPVRRALSLARTPVAFAALSSALQRHTGAAPEKVETLLRTLVEQDLLLTGLRPRLDRDPLRSVLDVLQHVPTAGSQVRALQAVAAGVAGLDVALGQAQCGETTAAVRAFDRVRTTARAVLPSARSAPHVVQTDAALPLAADGLNAAVGADVARAAALLLRLHAAPEAAAGLPAYRRAFAARYGEERAVPLLELLDPRCGLGPIDDVGHGHGSSSDGRSAVRGQRLAELAAAALRDGRREVVLDEALVDELAVWAPERARLPPTVELSAFVAAASPAAVDRGDYRVVVGPNLGAPEAGRGAGRFGDLLGPPVRALLAAVAAQESRRRPDALSAEVVWLPVSHRAANVAVRPHVHRHEIPVGVSPSVPDARTVRPCDLQVLLRDDRLRLWWTREGVEVVPRATHMLNTARAPAVVRFLEAVASDGTTGIAAFDWGAAGVLPFLPRVRVGRVVLRPAGWRLPAGRAGAGSLPTDDSEAFRDALRHWREQWRVPRHTYLSEGDNRLLLDLDEPEQVELLRAHARRLRSDVLLEEALPGPDDAWLPGPGGRHVVELVVPLVLTAPDPARDVARSAVTAPAPHAPADRVRAPGSDWLYLTLTGRPVHDDAVLAGPLRRLTEQLVDEGLVDGWFFVRYTDPAPHLRLRLHGRPAALRSQVLPRAATVAADLVTQGLRSSFGVESYERELERYGGPVATGICEQVFCADSAAVATLLAVAGTGDRDQRVELAVRTVDDLLAALGVHEPDRAAWCEASYGPSHAVGPVFRSRSAALRASLTDPTAAAPEEVAALARRRQLVAPLAARLAQLHRQGGASHDVPRLAGSLVHLHCNRLGLDLRAERQVIGLLARTRASLAVAPVTGRSGLERGQPGGQPPVVRAQRLDRLQQDGGQAGVVDGEAVVGAHRGDQLGEHGGDVLRQHADAGRPVDR